MQKPPSINLSFLALLGILYSVQSVLGSITFQGMPAVFRESGIEPIQIGLIYLLMLPWVFKFLWSAPLEIWRQKQTYRTKKLFFIVNGLAITILALLTITTPAVDFYLVFALLMVIAVLSSTVDIALDGYAIKESNVREKNWVNVMQIGGGYLGSIIGGGLFLLLVGLYDWKWAICAIVVFLFLMLSYVFFQQQSTPHQQSDIAPHQSLTKAFSSKKILYGISIVIIAQLGLRLAQGMAMPFFVDYGITLTQLGLVASFGGATVSLLAVFLTGLWIAQKGPWFVLLTLLVAQLFIYLSYYYFSLQEQLSFFEACVLFLLNSACAAASFVALYTILMRLTSPEQAGVDFSLLQSVDTAIALLAGISSGVLVQNLGYQNYFLFCCIASLSAVVTLPLLFSFLSSSYKEVI
ncbi:MFS transporter [Marinomonas sp. 2405UD66-6]|uniref:MFS transporter n=1 Tax=Marinomonas sp. 2405UD66-6 TaxID=3391834 RepID=UPI0039C9576C